jgi:hypothetical protein
MGDRSQTDTPPRRIRLNGSTESTRGQFASDRTLATTGNSLRKKFIPFGTDARVRRVYGNA